MNMKKLILILPLLGSCKAVDRALGLSPTEDKTEQTISSGETTIRTAGDMLIPGLGGALAVVFGLGARAYVKKRKQSQPKA
jgi:hypothetical protein